MERLAQEYTTEKCADTIIKALEVKRRAFQSVPGLTLRHEVLKDDAGQAVLDLLTSLAVQKPQPEKVAIAYTRAFRALITTIQGER